MMKEHYTIKEYSNKLLGMANKIKLLGNEFSYPRLFEKISATLLERFKASIISLEYTKIFVYYYFDKNYTCIASIRTRD